MNVVELPVTHRSKRRERVAAQQAYETACANYLGAVFSGNLCAADYRWLQDLAMAVFRARAELREVSK